MTTSLQRYQKLTSVVDRLQRELDRAEGAYGQLMSRMKEEHGCDTLEEAEKKAGTLERQSKKAEQEFETALDEFERKWEGGLGAGKESIGHE